MKASTRITTELIIYDESKVARLISNVSELNRENQRLARERAFFVVAFAITLTVLICVLCMKVG